MLASSYRERLIFYQVTELRESLEPKETQREIQARCSKLELQLGPFFPTKDVPGERDAS